MVNEKASVMRAFTDDVPRFLRTFDSSKSRFDVLYRIVSNITQSPKRVIVFVKRKEVARQVLQKLLALRFKAHYIHG